VLSAIPITNKTANKQYAELMFLIAQFFSQVENSIAIGMPFRGNRVLDGCPRNIGKSIPLSSRQSEGGEGLANDTPLPVPIIPILRKSEQAIALANRHRPQSFTDRVAGQDRKCPNFANN
jgi:hypothetical protein